MAGRSAITASMWMRVTPQNLDMVAKAIAPDYAVGPHTASLGLTFAEGSKLPPPSVMAHLSASMVPGTASRTVATGDFRAVRGGQPKGQPVDVLTGFLDSDEKAMGRPVGVVIDQQGDLLVADDVGNKVWRVSSAK